MPAKRPLPFHQKDDRREIAETPAPEAPSSSPTGPPAQKAKVEEERPESLKNTPGNMRWVDGETNENVAGIASIAYVAVFMLETLHAGNARPVDLEETKAFLKHIGGAQAVKAFGDKVHNTVGYFEPQTTPEETVFQKLYGDKAWKANPADDDGGETAPAGGREASIELGTTPAPMETTTTTAATTAGREREGSAELGAATEGAAGPVVIPSDPETSDEPLDSSDEPLAQKRARAAEKGITSKYFGGGGAGAGGASGKA
ncbi:hypothetical protein V8C26DRAFT_199268 [Trichoderma gracile]